MVNLDKEEQDLLESYERDEWQPVAHLEYEVERYREYARASSKSEMPVHIRLSKKDVEAIQKLALAEGIPYQSLIENILRKYADGRLVDEEL